MTVNSPVGRATGVYTPDRPLDAPAFIPVLLYHSVRALPLPGMERFTTRPDVFAGHVAALGAFRRGGATPMLITDLADALRGRIAMPARPFAVTFDDGYEDSLAAIRALADEGIPSTIYIATGLVGKPDMLDAEQLAELAENPMVEIGAHTVHHPRLDELPRQEIMRELQESRMLLQELTGAPIDSVAYPHGAHDYRVLDEARRAGYRSATAVKNALSRPGDTPYAIARWTVMDAHTAKDVSRVLVGGIPIVGSRERFVTRGYRVVRRTRHQLRARATALRSARKGAHTAAPRRHRNAA